MRFDAPLRRPKLASRIGAGTATRFRFCTAMAFSQLRPTPQYSKQYEQQVHGWGFCCRQHPSIILLIIDLRIMRYVCNDSDIRFRRRAIISAPRKPISFPALHFTVCNKP